MKLIAKKLKKKMAKILTVQSDAIYHLFQSSKTNDYLGKRLLCYEYYIKYKTLISLASDLGIEIEDKMSDDDLLLIIDIDYAVLTERSNKK